MNLNPEEVFLAQGTLRPDLIESASHIASGKAEVIKTHHNDTELIRKLRDEKQPSCRRSVVVRTFITSDFMTGIAAMPGNHIPEEV
ncbi:hypothetical protein GOODEAATRI_004140 [Goodea atripinnis]|uniref:Uncharacterized protein n=1 Tax=Goodea atripinnis TaxID=208336 RepID=A0ABV0MYI5_9TELE